MGTIFLEKYQKYMPVLCQEYMLFFCLPLSSQPRLRLLRPLSMSQHISAYTLGRGRAHIFDMSSTSGYTGEKYFQECGPRFFDMSSASGYMGDKYFQEFGSRFRGAYPLAHTPSEKYPRTGVLARGRMDLNLRGIADSAA